MSVSEESNIRAVAPRDLESILRKKFGNQLDLLHFDYESLLPPGENYGSSIFKIRAIVKDGKSSAAKERVLDLVAKMLPPTAFQRKVFDSPYSFRKEAFLYEQLIPSYRQLERDFGMKENELFDIVPEFFGVRYSLRSEEDFDDDAIILMQNLKVFGYYTGERREGLDFEHSKVAVKALARFHALGIAMKTHKPEFFEIIKFRSKSIDFPDYPGFDDIIGEIQGIIAEDPETANYVDILKIAMTQESAKNWSIPPIEPWSTITHADLWVNNIMFHKNPESNHVDDVKYVDFQNYLFLSPLRELIFFLMVSSSNEILIEEFDELLDIYYVDFIDLLTRMKCDVEPFSRDKFDERLKIDAFKEFPHCPFMLKMLCAEVDSNEKFDSVEKFTEVVVDSDKFINRLRRCINLYIQKKWLDQPQE